MLQALAQEFGWHAIVDRLHEHPYFDVFGEAPVIVDLGASQGAFARDALARFPHARMVLVEANPELAAALTGTFGEDTGVQVLHAAVGGRSQDQVDFYISTEPTASSLEKGLGLAHGLERGGAPVRVPMVTVSEVMTRCGLSRIDLLKMDVEGAELDVIAAFGGELAAIGQMTVEFHEFLDPALHARVMDAIDTLCRAGFRMIAAPTAYLHGSPYYMCLFYRPSAAVARRIALRAAANAAVAPFRVARRLQRRLAGAAAAARRDERANASEPARPERGARVSPSERVGGTAGAKPPGQE